MLCLQNHVYTHVTHNTIIHSSSTNVEAPHCCNNTQIERSGSNFAYYLDHMVLHAAIKNDLQQA